MREIIDWEKPEGFTDNSWSGLERDQIYDCKYSQDRIRKATGKDVPRRVGEVFARVTAAFQADGRKFN